MTTSNILYLLLRVAMFVAFSATLAYQSWQDAKLTAPTRPASEDLPESSAAAEA